MQAMLAPVHDERRLIAASVAASVALHAAALAFGPRVEPRASRSSRRRC